MALQKTFAIPGITTPVSDAIGRVSAFRFDCKYNSVWVEVSILESITSMVPILVKEYTFTCDKFGDKSNINIDKIEDVLIANTDDWSGATKVSDD